MSALPPAHGLLGPVPGGRYGWRGTVGSEWTKLTSVRSSVWALLTTAVLGVGLGAIVTTAQVSRWSTRTLAEQAAFDPTRSSLAGLLFAQLAIGVLGVLVVSAEYSTGTIRATFSAVPRRWLVLASKCVLFGFVALVVGEAVSFAAFLLGQQNPFRDNADGLAFGPQRPDARSSAAASTFSLSGCWLWAWGSSSGTPRRP